MSEYNFGLILFIYFLLIYHRLKKYIVELSSRFAHGVYVFLGVVSQSLTDIIFMHSTTWRVIHYDYNTITLTTINGVVR